MSDIAVAMILLALSGVVIIAMAIICRVLGVWKLSTLFGVGEEKVNLTKNEYHYNAYTAHVSICYLLKLWRSLVFSWPNNKSVLDFW